MKSKSIALHGIIALLITSFSSTLWALASDREQPIHISSDSAERNEKKGITIYTGSVQMDQGTLRINADKVVIHSIDNEIEKIVATGQPAKYQQKPSPEKQMVVAKGDTIEYMPENEKLFLINNASLRQNDGTTMTGKRIDYDIKQSLVKAKGNKSNTKDERIHMVIQPKRKQ